MIPYLTLTTLRVPSENEIADIPELNRKIPISAYP